MEAKKPGAVLARDRFIERVNEMLMAGRISKETAKSLIADYDEAAALARDVAEAK
jgi:hypothetical protein